MTDEAITKHIFRVQGTLRGSFWGSPTPEHRLNNVLSLDSFPQLDWSPHYDLSNGRHIKLELEFGVFVVESEIASFRRFSKVICFGLRHSILAVFCLCLLAKPKPHVEGVEKLAVYSTMHK